jgi:hypothetical protein
VSWTPGESVQLQRAALSVREVARRESWIGKPIRHRLDKDFNPYGTSLLNCGPLPSDIASLDPDGFKPLWSCTQEVFDFVVILPA